VRLHCEVDGAARFFVAFEDLDRIVARLGLVERRQGVVAGWRYIFRCGREVIAHEAWQVQVLC